MTQKPNIRTKTDRWHHACAGEVFDLLERLRHGELDAQAYQDRLMALLEKARLSQSLADEIAQVMARGGQLELVRRHVNECRYTVLLYRIDEGEAHPPHQHYNLISTQVILRGQIHIREYERTGSGETGRLTLKLVRDALLGPGDVFNASEWRRNVHWFNAVGGPALIFNINARGYEPSTLGGEEGQQFGRLYTDTTNFSPDGLVAAADIDPDGAHKLFASRPLDDFPVPPKALASASGSDGEPHIDIG
ncbi:MAG: hypothetical protein WBO55_00410 [Rhizobiaceae bacterium]